MKRAFDTRTTLGVLFIAGYYATLWTIGFRAIPADNVSLIKDAMLQLGPPIGMIVQSLFRTDRLDEQRAENTKAAFDAITAVAPPQPPTAILQPGQTAQAAGAGDDAAGDQAKE